MRLRGSFELIEVKIEVKPCLSVGRGWMSLVGKTHGPLAKQGNKFVDVLGANLDMGCGVKRTMD
jgi:hypothetical protein